MKKLISITILLFSLNSYCQHVYYINPDTGNDQNTGTATTEAWKSFKRLETLSAGTTVELLAGGAFDQSMLIRAKGTQQSPVKIKFAPGDYHFYSDHIEKRQLHISNTNDRPYEPKAIALFFDSCRYVQVVGTGARVILHGKMIETFVNHCDHISISGLSFDYNRPTVSELQITNVGEGYADALIHPDSKYSIKDSLITWIGDGWQYQPDGYWQVLNPLTNDLSRMDMPMAALRFVQLKDRAVRIYFKKEAGFKKGFVYQNRDVTRDCAAFFMQYSKNIQLDNIRLCFMHGMGVVSQYCENIRMNSVVVRPDGKSGRTCAAWADILHFAGCSGKVEVANAYLSAANDDAINVHGIHLQITEIQQDNKIKVKFAHGQTFGFDAFAAQDSIALIGGESLLAIQDNQVQTVERINDKEFLLTLSKPVAAEVKPGDAVENVSATPEVWIHRTTITRIPTRGILTTTRRKVLIENNRFENIRMSGIFINDDASGWFESGMVKDVTIRKNEFLHCGEPVISVHPENTVSGNTAVHSNITVSGNSFWLHSARLLEAKSTSNIKITGNNLYHASSVDSVLKFVDCSGVFVSGNRLRRK
ncbi:right-handed parallel beta-helix repeat-containing protein [Chitinophaga pinensis]|uniref:Alpha-galactosidase n=1 Tax=Chitinophaga pinensis (strain ATCC 43595 / DSM 2588 / LMG 13176 / NBRC 15968 / NCIMB 11800 / UQM 2034) TaxID=485918 RepID=A0A979G733_CHIPD|nr:right-handed parallel beta-helix repeat-containing protein [Chitinophaga pinensis]ACU61838.1 Alpha-galactosidase [Chitinophaga pinensis DSM 2588]